MTDAPYLAEPGAILTPRGDPSLGLLNLSTYTFPLGLPQGSVLAAITGTLDFNSIVSIWQSDESNLFELNQLGTALLAGSNYAEDYDGSQSVYLVEVNRRAIGSPFLSVLNSATPNFVFVFTDSIGNPFTNASGVIFTG